MNEHPKDYSELLREIAAAIQATEIAAFSVEGDDQQLRTLFHVRGDRGPSEAAIEAFKQILRPCLDQGKDGAIEIADGSPAGHNRFCLAILARRAGKIVGAAAFIVRCAGLNEAEIMLRWIQFDAKRFREGPMDIG